MTMKATSSATSTATSTATSAALRASLAGTATVLRIADIRRDRVYQVRTKLDEDTVADYASIVRTWQGRITDARFTGQSVDDIPAPFRDPITVACIVHPTINPEGQRFGLLTDLPEGALTLVDGWHRVEACEQAGRCHLPAHRSQGTFGV
ncbi:MAG: hypothetical protein ACYC9Z_16710 [Casimicrobiaceae bacterium]